MARERIHLIPGGEFKAGGVNGKVVSIGDSFVILEVQGTEMRLNLGESLREMRTLNVAVKEVPEAPQTTATLHLMNGGFASGGLVPSEDPAVLRWQSPSFASPFDFDLSGINAVYFPLPAQLPKPQGAYGFELVGGDILFGELVGLDAERALLDIPRLGRLHVRRSHLHRIDRWHDGAGLMYLGPNGLADWQAPANRAAWREEHGHLSTVEPGASVFGDFALPARAVIEFEISWKKKPDFVLALGVDSSDKSPAQAFRIEAWDRDLVLLRETDREADVATIESIPAGESRVHLQIYLDQEAGRCIVLSSKGKTLADLKISARQPAVLPGLRLANKRGDLTLERLRIGRWSGAPPGDVAADKSRLHLVDGAIAYGQVAAFDAATKQFTVTDESGTSRVAADLIASVFLTQTSEAPARRISAAYQDSTRISGEPLDIDEASLGLAVPGVDEIMRLPLAGLRSLIVLRRDKVAPSGTGPIATLEIERLKLRGRLTDAGGPVGGGALAWRPEGSATSSALRSGVSGRIVYREPPPEAPKPATPVQPAAVPVRRPANAVEAFVQAFAGDPPPRADGRKSLYLRTGDSISCEVTRIDENGLTFKSPLSDAVFVPHEKIKAVELAGDKATQVMLNKIKRDRLLTLPRMQKDSPPTHLIRSTNGDYLRGRIVEMDDRKLTVEVRLENRELPRDRIARIIWLHADEIEGATPLAASEPADPAEGVRVQAVRSDGIRLTFHAEQVANGTLSGTSDVLGVCHVALDKVDQVLIGRAIEENAAKLAYQQWKLQNAIEPKFASADGDSPDGRAPGLESALVGKPAPDFELDLLAGRKFRLSEAKGRIVILDFFATWCGPCLQSMPLVDQVARDFAERGVQVVAVNLEEAPRPITAMFERHKLSMPVALDRDGAVAAKYGVTSIPQTLVIDREGKVVRHFMGGGPRLGDDIALALRGLLDPPDPAAPAAP